MIIILVKINAFNVYYVGSTKILEFQASSSSKTCKCFFYKHNIYKHNEAQIPEN